MLREEAVCFFQQALAVFAPPITPIVTGVLNGDDLRWAAGAVERVPHQFRLLEGNDGVVFAMNEQDRNTHIGGLTRR